MSTRKLWATSHPVIPGSLNRHPSQAAAYRRVRELATRVDQLRSPIVNVWVNEQDGHNWQLFELVDLREIPHSGPAAKEV